MLAGVRVVASICHHAGELAMVDIYIYVDKRPLIIANAVLKGILDQHNQKQRRKVNLASLHHIGVGERYIDIVDKTDTHQLDVVLQKLDLLIESRILLARVVEHMTHHS